MSFLSIGIQLGVTAGLYALNRWVAPHFETEAKRKPRPEQMEFAQNAIGAPIPLVYGTMRVDNPILAWSGLRRSEAVAGGFGNFKYGASMLLIVGTRLVGETAVLKKIWFGEHAISFSPPLAHEQYIRKTWSLGGDNAGGEPDIDVQFFDGHPEQSIMQGITGDMLAAGITDLTLVPGYRHQMVVSILGSAITGHGNNNLGESARIPTISVEVDTRGTKGVDFFDVNPAWAICDLLTGPMNRLGLPASMIDYASFTAAADTLEDEAHGCSLVIYRDEEAPRVLAQLCEQIDGVLYESPNTGLIKLKLIRRDYNIASIPTMTKDNTMARPQISVTSWMECANAVNVTFTNRNKDYAQDIASDRRLANAVGQDGRVRVRDVSFPACTSGLLAAQLAAREMAQVGQPLTTCVATLDRTFYALEVGDALRAYWPDINVVDKVFRVLEVDDGQLLDGGIRVTMVEDVFDNYAGAVTKPWEGELSL